MAREVTVTVSLDAVSLASVHTDQDGLSSSPSAIRYSYFVIEIPPSLDGAVQETLICPPIFKPVLLSEAVGADGGLAVRVTVALLEIATPPKLASIVTEPELVPEVYVAV